MKGGGRRVREKRKKGGGLRKRRGRKERGVGWEEGEERGGFPCPSLSKGEVSNLGLNLRNVRKIPSADTAAQNIYVTEKYFLKLSFTTPQSWVEILFNFLRSIFVSRNAFQTKNCFHAV
jgi:hypothetical protein